MTNLIEKLKWVGLRIACWLPYPLPVGMQEFDTWASSIIKAYKFPDNDSVRFALSTMIMHVGPTSSLKPRRYFGLSVHKGMSIQIAHSVMLVLKEKQKAEQEAAAAAEKAAINVEAQTQG